MTLIFSSLSNYSNITVYDSCEKLVVVQSALTCSCLKKVPDNLHFTWCFLRNDCSNCMLSLIQLLRYILWTSKNVLGIIQKSIGCPGPAGLVTPCPFIITWNLVYSSILSLVKPSMSKMVEHPI